MSFPNVYDEIKKVRNGDYSSLGPKVPSNIGNFLKGLWNDYTGQTTSQQNIDYQKEFNQTQWQREDNAMQRTVLDYRSAGMNPLSINGVNPSNSVSAPKAIAPDMSGIVSLITMISNIALKDKELKIQKDISKSQLEESKRATDIAHDEFLSSLGHQKDILNEQRYEYANTFVENKRQFDEDHSTKVYQWEKEYEESHNRWFVENDRQNKVAQAQIDNFIASVENTNVDTEGKRIANEVNANFMSRNAQAEYDYKVAQTSKVIADTFISNIDGLTKKLDYDFLSERNLSTFSPDFIVLMQSIKDVDSDTLSNVMDKAQDLIFNLQKNHSIDSDVGALSLSLFKYLGLISQDATLESIKNSNDFRRAVAKKPMLASMGNLIYKIYAKILKKKGLSDEECYAYFNDFMNQLMRTDGIDYRNVE